MAKQFKADLRRATRPIKRALTVPQMVSRVPRLMRIIRESAAENNRRAWATRGSSFGITWDGAHIGGRRRLNDAVDTGLTKMIATSPYRLKPRVSRRRILMTISPKEVPYIRRIGRHLFGWDISGKYAVRIGEAITARMVEVASEELGS